MSEHRLPSLDDFAEAEHFVLEDTTAELPTLTNALEAKRELAQDLTQELSVNDRLRKRRTTVRLFAEGWIDVEVERSGREPTSQRIDLRYLDSVPATRRYRPLRLFRAAGILAIVTCLAAIPALAGWFPLYSIATAVVAFTASVGTLLVAAYMSHEKIVFKTLHGRANAIRFTAGLGTLRRFHALLPVIATAIADAAETVHDETAVYLRSEMREHYRLRNEGILTVEECAASTDRILGEFDGPL